MNSNQNDNGRTTIRSAYIAGCFTVIAACIGGLFLLLNTVLEKGFTFATGPVVQVSSPTQIYFVPNPTSDSSALPATTRPPETFINPSPETQKTNETVYLDVASSNWTDTGIYIQNGQYLTIEASGKVTTWQGNSAGDSYPDGNGWTCNDSDCILSGEKYGALIGMIGNSPPFFIGSNFTSPISISGYLYLRMNDNSSSYLDNSGTYTIQINVE